MYVRNNTCILHVICNANVLDMLYAADDIQNTLYSAGNIPDMLCNANNIPDILYTRIVDGRRKCFTFINNVMNIGHTGQHPLLIGAVGLTEQRFKGAEW